MVKWKNHYHRWHVLLEVSPKRLLQVADNTGEGFRPNKGKLNRLLPVFIAGEIDAPIVGLARKGQSVTLVDGRHRTTMADRLRMTKIAIAVSPKEKGRISGILNI